MGLLKSTNELYADLPLSWCYNDSKALSAGVAKTVTIPTGCVAAVFSGNSALGDYYIQFNHGVAAVVSVADTTDGSAPSSNAGMVRGLTPGNTISCISANSGILTIHWLAKPGYSG